MKRAFAVLSFALCGSLGCNQIADITDPIPVGSPGTPGSGPAGASSGSPDGTSDNQGGATSSATSAGDKSKFVGTWTGSTSTSADCLNWGTNPDVTLVVTEISKGLQLQIGDCKTQYTVSGSVATATPGAQCEGVTSDNFKLVLTLGKGSFTLSGSTGTLNVSGTADEDYGYAVCPFTQIGQFTKGS